MWLLTKLVIAAIAVAVTSALPFPCPRQCDCSNGEEREYLCKVGGSQVKFKIGINKYVNIECRGTNFDCSDLPVINVANNMTLPSLGVTGCSPSILQCVNEAFEASSVTTVTFSDAVDAFAEEDLVRLGDVQSFFIINASDASVPASAIKPLQSLRQLRICRGQITLTSNAFTGSPPLSYLELSEDELTAIPEDAFNGLSELKTLNVWGNNISAIGVNSLRGLVSLEALTLNTNKLTTIAAGALTHTPKLKSIKLSSNQLQELPAGLIHNLTQLENITIEFNEVELILKPKSISSLPSLKNMILEYNKITSLPENFLTGSDGIQKLSLAHNEIASLPAKIFKDQKSLVELDLSYNKIPSLSSGVFASLRELKTLNLNRNYLEVLPDVLFSGLTNLQFISIDHNSLSTISESAFQGATGLLNLSLAYNHLSFKTEPVLSGQLTDYFTEYFNIEEQSPLKTLTQLKVLNLKHNRIDTMFGDWVTVMVFLQELDLSMNRFSALSSQDLQFLSDHVIVDLRDNNITLVQLGSASQSPSDTSPRGSLLLDNNPLTCDCGIYNLAMRLRGARPISTELQIIVGNARCSSPPNLQGQIFNNVSPYDLNCDLPYESCHNVCLSCQFRPASRDLGLNCITTPPMLPNPSDFYVETISLQLQTAPQYIGNLSVQSLNLSNTGLEEILFSPSETIKIIDLSNNNLTTIPIEFLESNTTLFLSNNPIECDCWHSNEIFAIQKSVFIEDIERVTCRNGDKLVQVDVVALCSSWKAAAVAGGTFLVLVLLVTISALTISRYSRKIIDYLAVIFPSFFEDDLTDLNKEYDVFVSYAHKDGKFFLELLPKLENDFGQTTCVHYRDWYVGDFIPEQIRRSVETSRKTIILMSGNYLESAYANMEFNAAHSFALKEGKVRVILIMLEDVSNHEKLSDELKEYISNNTYLTWDDPKFWERLHKALPLRNNKKFVWPVLFGQPRSQTTDQPDKIVKSGLDVHINSRGQLVNVAMKDMV